MFRFSEVADLIPFKTPISGTMAQAIELWMDMYTDNPPWKSKDIVTMNLPCLIASELARIATIEMESKIEGGPRAKYLMSQYQRVLDDARKITEYAAAGGSLALKPYTSGGNILVDYVRAGMFWPTAYSENSSIIGCSFIDQITKGDLTFVKIEHHHHNAKESTYTITTKAYLVDGKDATRSLSKAKEVPLSMIDEWSDMEPENTLQNVKRPLFSILQMPIANNVELGTPLGVSCYARAADLIQEADKQFSRLLWEMDSAQRAVHVDIRAMKTPDARDIGGATRINDILPFKRLYRAINNPDQDSFFKEWSPEIREANQVAALDEILRRIEDACSLARGTLSSTPEGRNASVMTATGLKIMRQRTYATCVDMQQSIKRAFTELVGAMDILAARIETSINVDTRYTITFDFDDSVVSDRDAQFQERLILMDRGIYSAEEFRAWYFGEEIEDAKKNVSVSLTDERVPLEE